MTRASAEIVVVGAGMAGLCAAIAALEAGARVSVIEKGTRPGGTLWLSSGLIWTFRDFTELRGEIPDGDPTLQQLVVLGLPDGWAWLERQGVNLGPEHDFMWYGRGRLADPKQLTIALAERVRALGGGIRLRTALRELSLTNGTVTGVDADGTDGPAALAADAIILATGGFQGNADLLQCYVTSSPGRIYLRANPWSTGDGFLAAAAAGAAVTPNLDAVYGHAIAAPPTRFDEREFQAAGQRYGPVAVALNVDGRRFTDESAGTGEEHLNAAIARQRGAAAVYIVDAHTARLSYYGSPTAQARIDWLRDRDGPFAEAESIEELCEALGRWGIPAQDALATLTAYNRLVEAQPDALHPPRLRNRHALARPPFYAVLVRPGITFTCGGLQVDPQMRVLRRSASVTSLPLVFARVSELIASPIPGLYAAGCDAGGFSADGYMGGLATALVTGRIAGGCAASSAC